ncbi:hypothetical protein [Vibrio tubiashii]|uniref:hypothetical protein n=1 Tax=Vibrio tubiashii TaxID=29498 RepID=UPI00349E7862
MKKKLLPLALAAAAGFTGVTAQAQMVQNHDGTGDLLMYPIYTANGGNDTYISIANTTSDYKAVKVRFVDAMNSQDSLDFHLYLSPEDHWSGVVTKEGDGAVLKTGDTSCTVPNSLAASAVGQLGTTAPMRTAKYAAGGAEADAINNDLSRTLEGHVEVIEMGVIPTTGDHSAAIRAAILHSNGVPGKCSDLEAAWTQTGALDATKAAGAFYYTDEDSTPGNFTAAPLPLDAPTGGLYGYGVIINVPDGTAAMFDAVAVDNFMANGYHPTPGDDEPGVDDGVNTALLIRTHTNTIDTDGTNEGTAAVAAPSFVTFEAGENGGVEIVNAAGDATALTLGQASERHISATRGRTGSRLIGGGNLGTANDQTTGAAGSKEALSALLMRTSISNDYVLEPGLNAATDWVVTFPTKRDFVNMAPTTAANTTVPAEAPFSNLWDHSKTESCETIAIDYWDREEGKETISTSFDFSPAPVTTPTTIGLCAESNIVNFKQDAAVLGGSSRITKVLTLASGFNNGWATIKFSQGSQELTGATNSGAIQDGDVMVKGLPVIGFAIQKYVNNAATSAGALANYAGSIGHHYASEVIELDAN